MSNDEKRQTSGDSVRRTFKRRGRNVSRERRKTNASKKVRRMTSTVTRVGKDKRLQSDDAKGTGREYGTQQLRRVGISGDCSASTVVEAFWARYAI